jgi:AraC-like DNA-binding protein
VGWQELTLLDAGEGWSDPHRPASPRLLLPLAGWLECEIASRRFVCDPLSPLWLTAEHSYRLRQPCAGQRSLLIVLGDDPGAPPPGQRRLALPAPVQLARWRARHPCDTATLEAALLRLASQVAGDPPPPCSPRVQRAVEHARGLLASDLARPLTLADTAAAVHCSPHHLARQFQRVNGVGPHGYRTRLRMLAALERLREGDSNLSGLAQDLGFASHSHFSATFRGHWGLTPQQMRKDLTAAALH